MSRKLARTETCPQPKRRNLLGYLGTLSLAACGGGSSDTSTSDGTGVSNTDATLATLTLSQGSLSPAFDSGTTSYTVSVTNSVASVTFTATATDSSGASIAINGTVLEASGASLAVALEVGSNVVSIIVTSASGSVTQTYTITVVRASATSGTNCALIPTETQGPYPLLAILSNSTMVRSDIREDCTGIPLTLTLTLQDINSSCAAVSGAAVYIWHCDKDGEYSGYSSTANGSHLGETFLRGIQVTDSAGQVSFTTIYPGWYTGRITHVHFQVYINDNLAVTATVTSQIAFPQEITKAVYDTTLYATHGQNTSVTDFAYDNVFSDGTSLQMASLSGDVSSGYNATLVVGLAL